MCEGHDIKFDEFVRTIRLNELCSAASVLLEGLPCRVDGHTIGGYNVIYNISFSDGIVWMARITLPYTCFQPEEVSASYAATMKYLKKHSSIPVPQIFGFCLRSDPTNKTNVTYILMEWMRGHHLPVIERQSLDTDPKGLAKAKKVHEQLTDVILQMAALKFDKIGSLREDSEGNFYVGPYVDSNGTAYPRYKAEAYKSLGPENHGPFESTSDWYAAISQLNRQFTLEDPEEEGDRDESVAEYELLAEFAPKIVVEEYANGPFVINHNDLTLRNILVDDDFNVTAILDFPGNIVPVPSLCVFPWMFSDNISGLVVERNAYRDVFLNRQSSFPSSALHSLDVRKRLMETAENRQMFEIGLLGPYICLVLPALFQKIYERKYDSSVECRRFAETKDWFKRLVKPGEDGLYSWER